jgi:hypothetical protein
MAVPESSIKTFYMGGAEYANSQTDPRELQRNAL